MAQYHLTQWPANDSWPNGGWSLYQIDGDQIADRTRFENGKVVARWPWPGFIGCFATLPEVMAAIESANQRIG